MRSPRWFAALGLLNAAGAFRASSQGRTDIWVASLKQEGRSVVVGAPVNVTHRVGYDNQPSFTPDGALLYTSIGDDGRASTWTVRSTAGATPSRLTNTAIGIYSPTVTPDGKFFSVIRVEPDSVQRLWKFPLAGGEPSLVIAGIKPVGYHAWIDARTVVVFVLGTPSTLQVVDVTTGNATTVASSIGRALVKVPHHDAVNFVQVVRDSGQWLAEYDAATKSVRRLGRLPQGADYVAWTPGGALITAARSVIYSWDDGEWKVVVDLSGAGIRNISRLAISASGDQLAFVADDPVLGQGALERADTLSSLLLVVRDSANKPIADGRLYHILAKGRDSIPFARTDSLGQFLMRGLRPGCERVFVTHPRFISIMVFRAIRGGVRDTARIQLSESDVVLANPPKGPPRPDGPCSVKPGSA